MKATVEYIKERFGHFNRLLFGGRLPELPVALGDAAGYAGKCEFRKRRLPDGRTVSDSFVMRINTRIDMSAEEIDDTIIHEMIHYFIELHGLPDTSVHGDIFKAIMNGINAAHGRKVSVRKQLTATQRGEANATKRRLHAVAVIRMRDGRTGLKVVPRIEQRILAFNTDMRKFREVASVEFFLSANPYFGRFPSSTALRVYFVDEPGLREALTDSRPIRIENGRVEVD